MLRIACCDDDAAWAEGFVHDVGAAMAALDQSCTVDAYVRGEDLLAAVTRDPKCCDLLFLDVVLDPEDGFESGFDLARRLRALVPDLPIILISASPDFALEGYAIHPLHYLVKPIPAGQLREALLYALRLLTPQPPLIIREAGSLHVVPLQQILYIEVFDHQLHLHTFSGAVLTTPGSLSRLERELPQSQFFRCHKSYLVNLAHVSGIKRYQIRFSNGQVIPVSKQSYGQVYQAAVGYLTSFGMAGGPSGVLDLEFE